MIVLIVDPSSSCTGIVKMDILPSLPDPFQKLIWKGYWKPQSKRVPRPSALVEFSDSLDEIIIDDPPADAAIVLQLASMRGAKTVRTLSHFESAAYMTIERRHIPIFTIRDGDARHHALGLQVTVSKKEAIEVVVARYPMIRWSPFGEEFDGPGGDEVDAFVGGLAFSKATKAT